MPVMTCCKIRLFLRSGGSSQTGSREGSGKKVYYEEDPKRKSGHHSSSSNRDTNGSSSSHSKERVNNNFEVESILETFMLTANWSKWLIKRSLIISLVNQLVLWRHQTLIVGSVICKSTIKGGYFFKMLLNQILTEINEKLEKYNITCYCCRANEENFSLKQRTKVKQNKNKIKYVPSLGIFYKICGLSISTESLGNLICVFPKVQEMEESLEKKL